MKSIIGLILMLVLSSSGFHIQMGMTHSNSTKVDGLFVQAHSNSLSLPSIDWNQYHNYTEIVAVLQALNSSYPSIIDLFSIGKSWWNRDIYCVRLTNESDLEPKPEILFVGYHHAQEQITAELALYFIVYAATNFGLNETMTELLNGCEIYVVVALNVDGFDLFEVNDWHRKNACLVDEDFDGSDDEDPPEDEDGDGFVEILVNYTNPQFPEVIRF